MVIVCGSIPTLKPIWDFGHDRAKSALSYFSTVKYSFGRSSDTSTKPSSYGSRPKNSIPLSGDSPPAGGSYRLSSVRKSLRRPSQAGPQVANEIHGYDNDGNSLLERGTINVVNGWEVNREQRDLSHPLGSSSFVDQRILDLQVI